MHKCLKCITHSRVDFYPGIAPFHDRIDLDLSSRSAIDELVDAYQRPRSVDEFMPDGKEMRSIASEFGRWGTAFYYLRSVSPALETLSRGVDGTHTFYVTSLGFHAGEEL